MVLSHEKLNDNEDAGIIKMTKKIKLPTKPNILDIFIKKILPK